MEADLSTAVARMQVELGQSRQWLKELEVERHSALRRIENLRHAIHGLAALLPEAAQEKALLNMIEPVPARQKLGPAIGTTERSAAVMEFLAIQRRAHVSTADLQRHLDERALAHDSRTASRMLTRKAAQGIVTRTGRGEYRVNLDHPELVRVRRRLAQD